MLKCLVIFIHQRLQTALLKMVLDVVLFTKPQYINKMKLSITISVTEQTRILTNDYSLKTHAFVYQSANSQTACECTASQHISYSSFTTHTAACVRASITLPSVKGSFEMLVCKHSLMINP